MKNIHAQAFRVVAFVKKNPLILVGLLVLEAVLTMAPPRVSRGG